MIKQSIEKNSLPKYFHAIVTVFIMFVVSMLPTVGPVTRYGMQVLGILAGVVYGMSMVDVFWPALTAILGLGLISGDMAGVLRNALGSDVVWGMIMIFVILHAMEKEDITNFFSNWIINRKVLKGRPWLFSFAILLGVSIVSVVSPEAAMLLFWEIIYETCDNAGIERNHRWSIAMIFGTCLAAGLGVLMLPVMRNGLIIVNIFREVTGTPLSYIQYIITMIPLAVVSIAIYILISKYIFRVDVSSLKLTDNSISDKENLTLNPRQIFIVLGVVIMVVLLLIPSLLPREWQLTGILRNFGLFGISSILVLVFCVAKVGGQPIVNIQQAASKSVIWPMVVMVALILPIGSALTNPDSGIIALISGNLAPFLAGKAAWVLIGIVVVIGAILTNFAQNLVIFSVVLPILFAMSTTNAINIPAGAILIAVGTHYAMVLPSASPSAGMMFSNPNFKATYAYKEGMITMVILLTFIMTIGYAWVNFVFSM